MEAISASVGENGPEDDDIAVAEVEEDMIVMFPGWSVIIAEAEAEPLTARAEALCNFNATSASSSALDAASVQSATQSTVDC